MVLIRKNWIEATRRVLNIIPFLSAINNLLHLNLVNSFQYNDGGYYPEAYPQIDSNRISFSKTVSRSEQIKELV